jgi:hypothetical protein
VDHGRSSDRTGKAGSNVPRTGRRGTSDRSGEVNRLRRPGVRVRNQPKQSHPCRPGGNVGFASSERGTGETSGNKRTKKSDRLADIEKGVAAASFVASRSLDQPPSGGRRCDRCPDRIDRPTGRIDRGRPRGSKDASPGIVMCARRLGKGPNRRRGDGGGRPGHQRTAHDRPALEPDKTPLAERRSVHRRRKGRGRERESLSGDEQNRKRTGSRHRRRKGRGRERESLLGDEQNRKRTGSRHRERKERGRERESLSGDERNRKRTGGSQRNGP